MAIIAENMKARSDGARSGRCGLYNSIQQAAIRRDSRLQAFIPDL
jgi:hypothetical protein